MLDDVTVTQVSAVWQLHQANPEYGPRKLYGAAVEIGRDHIASTVNTLVLAYAGASLPLLLLFTQAGRRLADVEVVRTLVGSIGLVTAVPVTTALAALVVSRGARPGSPAEPPPPAPQPAPVPVAPGPPPLESEAEPDWDQFAPGDPPLW